MPYPPPLSLRQLRYLVALSEQLNFTRAAESCHVTQSTLSAGLKELEGLLGRTLVERDRQRVLMTPLGQSVADQAKRILAASRDLVAFASAADAPMSGTLRLGVIPTIAPFLVPAALTALRTQHPALRIALREDLTANLLKRVEQGQLDFALIALPFDVGALEALPLFSDELWLVARADDPAVRPPTRAAADRHRSSDDLGGLADRLLLLEEGHCLREHALFACGRTRSAPADASTGELTATSLLTLMQMVESGFGVALVPELAVRGGLADSPGLRTRPMGSPAPTRTVALVSRRSTPRRAELEALAEQLRLARPAKRRPNARAKRNV